MGANDESQPQHRQLVGVTRRLLERVWAVTGHEQVPELLLEMRDSLDPSIAAPCRAVLYLVTPKGEHLEVRHRELAVHASWCRSAAGAGAKRIVALWQARAGGRLLDAPAASPPVPVPCCAGLEVRAALEVPFSHGVLGLYSDRAGAFGQAAVCWGEEMGLVLSVLYHRLADLAALQTKERQLRQVQRLQLVGQLTAEVAHDLNNPLSVITGECAILLGEAQDRDTAEGVQAIQRAADQARALSHRLLDFVRGNRLEKDWTNFNRLVQETVELVRRVFAKEGIELTTELERNLPWIEAHEGQVQQVILNLLQNAREALRGYRPHGAVMLRTYARDGSVVLEVEDNGPGIPEDIAQHIFEPFFTTKSSSEGTGLGLSVCAGIAREHGGEIRLEPRALGTCMALQLPVRQACVQGALN